MQKRSWRGNLVRAGLLIAALPGCSDDPESPSGNEAGALDGSTSIDGAVLTGDTGSNPPDDGGASVDVSTHDVYTLPTADAEAGQVTVPPCNSSAGADGDSDGFAAPVDCNDCDSTINPAAFDVAGNGLDEDCSGRADDEPQGCDKDVPANSSDAMAAARTLGLCRMQTGSSWGLTDAKWVFPDGTTSSIVYFDCPAGRPPHPLSHSLRESYGPKNLPTEGKKLAVLSTGLAVPGNETLGDQYLPATGTSPSVTMCTASKPPAGFPKIPQECMQSVPKPQVNDGVALELTIKVPSNANAFAYDFFFLSSEFPVFVCQGKSDHFVALLSSKHAATPTDKNISFDSAGSVVSVDTAFLEVCTPVTYQGRTFACKRGPSAIEGLGFTPHDEDGQMFLQGGATGWLQTRAPIVPGETITIRFAIWDAQDALADSTVLLDNVHWVIPPRMVNPPPPPMKPVTTWIDLL